MDTGGGDSNTEQDNAPTKDIQGNQGAPGQFGQQGQYGAVTGSGFGGSLAKDAQGQSLQGGKQGQKDSPYEGMDNDDSAYKRA